MSETGSDTRSGIGARLRAGRERMSLTQLQMAEKLHVDPKVVESLEAERFDALGAPVFVRGHLKRYADFIGENASQLIEIYSGATPAAFPDLTRLPKAAPETKPSKLAVPALLVLIAFVLLGVFWWIFQSVKSTSQIRPAPNARQVPVEPDLSSPIGDGPAGEADAGGAAAGAASSADVASADTAPTTESSASASGAVSSPSTNAPGAPLGAAGSATTVSSVNTSATGVSGTSGTASAAGAATSPAQPMQVTLKFSADSWVEVYDAKGEKLFYDIGSANSQKSLSGTPPFRVVFGNAPGVTFDVNGKPGAIPDSALKDDTAQFVINPSGRIVRARTQPQGPQASGSPQRAAAPPEGT